MPLFPRRQRDHRLSSPLRVSRTKNSLTASGERIRPRTADRVRQVIQPWQSLAFNYYDRLGEIKYASQFYARMLAPLVLFAAEIDENGDVVATDNEEAKAALERIQDPGGGRTGLLGTYGRLMFLTGEALLFVSLDPETGEERWEMLSSDELRVQDGIYLRYKAPSLGAQEYRTSGDGNDDDPASWVPVDDKTAVAYRLWQRHPRFSYLADSTMQGVLDLCEELVLLTQAVRARTRSRLAGSGLMLIDERISPAPPEPGPDEDPIEDVFMADLTEAMTRPIADEGAASAIVPLLARVTAPESGKVADLIHHLQIVDPTQLYPETGLRYECIKRIAIGLDMPPEILLGMEESNHWTAWQIDEQTWKGHGQPKAQQLVDDLTASYYRPYLRDIVGMGDEATKFVIGYDPAAIINHPDRTKDAKDLYDKRAIGKQALREAAGFDEEDAPTDDELAEMIGVAVRDSSLAWFGEPSPRGGAVETAPGEIVDSGGTVGIPGPSKGADVEKSAPSAPPEPSEVVVGSMMVARILGAADLAIVRAREAAGNRLKGLAKRDPEILELVKDARSWDVAAILGRERTLALKAPPARELVAGAHDLIVDAFRVWGINGDIAQRCAETIEQHAARTLFEKQPRSLPDSFGGYIAQQIGS